MHSNPLLNRPTNDRTREATGRWRAAPLGALLALTLFPFEWLGAHWRSLGRMIDTTFPTDLQHAIGHFSLFALLGGLALATFPNLRARPWRYAGLLALAGLGQECFQLLFKQRPINFDDGRDLVVDLAGLALAFVLVQIWEWWRREA